MKRVMILLFAALLVTSFNDSARSEGFGGGGMIGSGSDQQTFDAHWDGGPLLKPIAALEYITVDGTAEVRVVPEEIRVVLAVMAEGETAEDCQARIERQIEAVLADWANLKISNDRIVQDFISVLPRYEWRLEERDGEEVGVQRRTGYRMQTNLHLAVETEQRAMTAINRAFRHAAARM